MSLVTIIIPYKNNLKYLFLALESVFFQTYKKFKIIIIYDDENKSDLLQIKKFVFRNKKIRKYSIKILTNKKNIGAGESRNIGIKLSKTKYIAFLDSDDVWHKDKLKFQVNYMINDRTLISHTSYNIIDESGKKISLRKSKNKLYFKDILNSCDIGLSTVMIDLKFLKKNNLKFPKIKTKEDYVLWLKMRNGICLYGSEDVALNCNFRLDFVVLGARCASPKGSSSLSVRRKTEIEVWWGRFDP